MGGDKRRWTTVARFAAATLALGLGLDDIARTIATLLLAREIVTWVPPFTKAHELSIDLLLSFALLVIAALLLKVFKPMLPKETRGIGYVAAVLAAAIALSAAIDPLHHPASTHGLTASSATRSRPGLTSGGSHPKAPKSESHRPASGHASSSAPRRSAHSSGSPDLVSATGSSSASSAGSASRPTSHQDSSSQPSKQTHTPVRATHSPSVEFEGGQPAASTKTSPTVEVKSEKERSGGIEVASN